MSEFDFIGLFGGSFAFGLSLWVTASGLQLVFNYLRTIIWL